MLLIPKSGFCPRDLGMGQGGLEKHSKLNECSDCFRNTFISNMLGLRISPGRQ